MFSVDVFNLAEASVGGGVGDKRYTKFCRRYKGVVRQTGCLYASQTCEEAFHAFSLYTDYRDGRVGMRSAGCTGLCKIQRLSELHTCSLG